MGGGGGNERMNPKPNKKLSLEAEKQSPRGLLLGMAFSHSPKFFCPPL